MATILFKISYWKKSCDLEDLKVRKNEKGGESTFFIKAFSLDRLLI